MVLAYGALFLNFRPQLLTISPCPLFLFSTIDETFYYCSRNVLLRICKLLLPYMQCSSSCLTPISLSIHHSLNYRKTKMVVLHWNMSTYRISINTPFSGLKYNLFLRSKSILQINKSSLVKPINEHIFNNASNFSSFFNKSNSFMA